MRPAASGVRSRASLLCPFPIGDRGALATIGRAAAVADFGRLKLTGFLAWLAWMLVHIAFLIGFRNRVFVLLSWAWAYLTFQRGARLITGGSEQLLPRVPVPDGQEDGHGATPAAPVVRKKTLSARLYPFD